MYNLASSIKSIQDVMRQDSGVDGDARCTSVEKEQLPHMLCVAFYQDEKIVLGKSACYFNVTVGLQKLFVKLLLECPDFMTYAEKSTTGTTIMNFGLKAIGDWPIALPSLVEQSRIVTRIAALRRLCADLRARLAASQSTQAHLAEVLIADLPT